MGELRRKGRPVLDISERRDKGYRIRLREDEYEKMVDLAAFYDITLADVIRLGLENNYELHRRGQDIRYFG